MEKKISFYEVIDKRRTIRQFDQEEIPKEVLERIINAGLKAPSGGNKRECELAIITDKDIILDLAKFILPSTRKIKDEPKTPQQEMFKIAIPRQKTMVEESTCVILVLYKQKHSFTDPNNFGLMDYASSWTLIENILLAATYEGLGTGIRVPDEKETQKIKDFMKIPYNYYLPAMILLGYAPEDVLLPKREPPDTKNKVHWNQW